MPAVTVIFSKELYEALVQRRLITGQKIPEIIKEIVNDYFRVK